MTKDRGDDRKIEGLIDQSIFPALHRLGLILEEDQFKILANEWWLEREFTWPIRITHSQSDAIARAYIISMNLRDIKTGSDFFSLDEEVNRIYDLFFICLRKYPKQAQAIKNVLYMLNQGIQESGIFLSEKNSSRIQNIKFEEFQNEEEDGTPEKFPICLKCKRLINRYSTEVCSNCKESFCPKHINLHTCPPKNIPANCNNLCESPSASAAKTRPRINKRTNSVFMWITGIVIIIALFISLFYLEIPIKLVSPLSNGQNYEKNNLNESIVPLELTDRNQKILSVDNPLYEFENYPIGELRSYAFQIINEERKKFDVSELLFGENMAAQAHAEELLKFRRISHFGSDGSKPYTRYTSYGGMGAITENVAIYCYNMTSDYLLFDAKEEVKNLTLTMIYADVDRERKVYFGHKANTLDLFHNKVSIGVAYSNDCLLLVQHFENDYINWSKISLNEGILIMTGNSSLGRLTSIWITYDPLPESLTEKDISNLHERSSYDEGEPRAVILRPNTKIQYLAVKNIEPEEWNVRMNGYFTSVRICKMWWLKKGFIQFFHTSLMKAKMFPYQAILFLYVSYPAI
ncbi:hypothetical protein HYU11_05745 [Candidatus Woesearchaeota archaeon]|nr:hypothetical protein [Candidatus Woesearchaeota archaeon]